MTKFKNLSILFESSALAQSEATGVGYFSRNLIESVSRHSTKSGGIDVSYLWLNFLGQKDTTSSLLLQARDEHRLVEKKLLPQRLYAKLVYANIAPPIMTRRYDWSFFPNFYVWNVPRAKQSAVIIHDLCFLRYPEYIEEKNLTFLRATAIRSIKRADLIVVNSEFTRSEILALTDTVPDKVLAIDIPIDPERFGAHKDGGMEQLGNYGVHKEYFLHIGTLEPRKNLRALVDAYISLPATVRNKYSLFLGGKIGWKFADDMAYIQSLQKKGFDILTPGYIADEDSSAIYRNATLYVLPSHYEGFGMPLLEALYCGIPTIASQIPPFVEVAGDSCVWTEGTADEIAKNIQLLLADKAQMRKLSAAGPVQAARYNWDATAAKLVKKLQMMTINGTEKGALR